MYKITLPLRIVYQHYGNLKDYPLRIICTPSAHFTTSGKDCDIIIPKPGSNAVSSPDIDNIQLEITDSVVSINTLINLKYTPDLHGSYHIPPQTASICFNLACSMKNEYGRRCWRNGGTCYFNLIELLGNSKITAKEAHNLGGKVIFTTRRLYNSGYNVAIDDKITGCVKMALGPEIPKYNYIQSPYFNKVSPHNTIKWSLLKSNGYFFLSTKTTNNNLHSCSSLLTNHQEKEDVDEGEIPFKLLFGFELDVSTYRSQKSSSSSSTPLINLTCVSSDQSTTTTTTTLFKKEVHKLIAEYESMLKKQNQLVIIDDVRTKAMKCPWCPMDSCVWEFFSDYSDPYYVFQNEGSNNDKKASINDKYMINHTELIQLPCIKGHTTTTTTKMNNDDAVEDVGYMSKISNAFKMTTIGCKNNLSVSGISNHHKSQSLHGNVNLESNVAEKRIYLPFFTYLMAHPLRLFKGYWSQALKIQCERKGETYESYKNNIWPKLTPSEKVSDAFQMILMYVQSIEYISDYYYPKKVKRKYNSYSSYFGDIFNGDDDDDDDNTANNASEVDDDCRIEIEQFWNCLRSLCGDCDDLTLGNSQFYRAFVEDSWSNYKINQIILSCPILTEMRLLLVSNYIMLMNIDGVYLPRQKASTTTTNSVKPTDHTNRNCSGDTYQYDTVGLNSAHASLKLIPKLFFERSVNRSCTAGGTSAIFPPYTDSSCTACYCCNYHKYPPNIDFNDDLPVLFGEGTSMLICSEDVKEPANVEHSLRKAMFRDPMVDDVTKSLIYTKEKGVSTFYKASFFGACLDFLKTHRIATFTYARLVGADDADGDEGKPHFSRGVSHKQLAMKDERVVLVPYGHDTNNTHGSGIKKNTTIAATAASVPHYDLCDKVQFRGEEISPAMYHLCVNETKKRIKARKIRDPKKHTPLQSLRYENDMRICRYTGTSPYDTMTSVEESKATMQNWAKQMNQHYSGGITTRTCHNTIPDKTLVFYVDLFYINQQLLARLSKIIFDSYRPTFNGGTVMIRIVPKLESHSTDIHIWRITLKFFNT